MFDEIIGFEKSYIGENDLISVLSNKNFEFLGDIYECEVDNKKILLKLEKQFEQANIIPFVGAGLSAPYDSPIWSKFLKNLAERCSCLSEIEKLLSHEKFEEAADKLRSKLGYGLFDDYLEDTYGEEPYSNIKELKGAVALLPLLTKGPVITTNYDPILEKIFNIFGDPFIKVVVGARAKLAAEAFTQGRRFLLKIHGEANDPRDRILIRRDYKKYYGPISQVGRSQKPLPDLLRSIFKNRAVLFLGCSLESDRTMEILRAITNDEGAFITTP